MGSRIRQRRSENSISRGLGSPHSMIGPPRAGLLSVLRTGWTSVDLRIQVVDPVCDRVSVCASIPLRTFCPVCEHDAFLDQTRKVPGFLDCSTSIPLQIFYLGRIEFSKKELSTSQQTGAGPEIQTLHFYRESHSIHPPFGDSHAVFTGGFGSWYLVYWYKMCCTFSHSWPLPSNTPSRPGAVHGQQRVMLRMLSIGVHSHKAVRRKYT
ncbi:hypothetical protein BDP67DRAFT_493917 [Colletotrichum lupini]|nr:hypothetical protein BDP67DRAFT_493917 [Colletotrichum lupini]